MKILSKYKDYWDYAVGYDTDDRKVWVRDYTHETDDLDKINVGNYGKRTLSIDNRRFSIPECGKMFGTIYNQNEPLKHKEFNILCICGKAYQLLEIVDDKQRKIFIGKDIPLEEVLKLTDYSKDFIDKYINNKKSYYYKWHFRGIDNISVPCDTNVNKYFNSPVVKICYTNDIHINPPLKDYGFGSIMSPQEIYTEIYNWIPFYEPETDSDPTNMNRFTSKGFDKKTSFRNIK